MKKSLWTACFTSSIGWGGDGIIMIDGNQICGADENFYYHGAYSINASNIATAQIHVKSYGTSPHSILPGINEYTTCFSGPYDEERMDLTSEIVEPLHATVFVRLIKIVDL